MKFEIILKEISDKDVDKINENSTLIIPDAVTTIGQGAFWGIYPLTNITIPNNVTKIEADAFADCLNLYAVTLPENLQELHYTAFRNCKNLITVFAHKKNFENIPNLKEYFEGDPEFMIIKEKQPEEKTK